MRTEIERYVRAWQRRGYPEIPDSVPYELMRQRLAPSYQAIAYAILKNDIRVLGFEPKASKWYGILKRIELGTD